MKGLKHSNGMGNDTFVDFLVTVRTTVISVIQSGASGCGEGFVKCFLKVPISYLGSTLTACFNDFRP